MVDFLHFVITFCLNNPSDILTRCGFLNILLSRKNIELNSCWLKSHQGRRLSWKIFMDTHFMGSLGIFKVKHTGWRAWAITYPISTKENRKLPNQTSQNAFSLCPIPAWFSFYFKKAPVCVTEKWETIATLQEVFTAQLFTCSCSLKLWELVSLRSRQFLGGQLNSKGSKFYLHCSSPTMKILNLWVKLRNLMQLSMHRMGSISSDFSHAIWKFA